MSIEQGASQNKWKKEKVKEKENEQAQLLDINSLAEEEK